MAKIQTEVVQVQGKIEPVCVLRIADDTGDVLAQVCLVPAEAERVGRALLTIAEQARHTLAVVGSVPKGVTTKQ